MAAKGNTTRISVTVSRADYELLKTIAEAEARSISNMVGLIIKDYLNKEAGGN